MTDLYIAQSLAWQLRQTAARKGLTVDVLNRRMYCRNGTIAVSIIPAGDREIKDL